MVFRWSPELLSFEDGQHYLLILRKITGDYGLLMEPGLPLVCRWPALLIIPEENHGRIWFLDGARTPSRLKKTSIIYYS
jgi:hypothetical protein